MLQGQFRTFTLNTMKKHYRSENNCLNCGATVTGKFCSECGQENLELHEDFLHLALHGVGHYFHFESKFFNSIIPLITKPGFLTKEYFAGRRASYLSPISMYIFISIVFFFLSTANTNINRKNIEEDVSPEEQAEARAILGRVSQKVSNKIPEKLEEYNTYTTLGPTELADTANPTQAKAATQAMAKGDTVTAPKEKNKDALSIDLGGDNVVTKSLTAKLKQVKDDELSFALFKNKLTSHLPKVMFILLPLFALILKLVNWRSSKYYVEHLIYSIHVHSFLFLFSSILILLGWILPSLSDYLLFIGMIGSMWYIYRSMRNTYKGSRWMTVSKVVVLFLAYTSLLSISALFVVAATLYTM